MTKLLTIEVKSSTEPLIKGILYEVHVIANDQENILILKDLIEDRGQNKLHCWSVNLSHCYQKAYELLPEYCTKGKIVIQCTEDLEIPQAMQMISEIILSFIL